MLKIGDWVTQYSKGFWMIVDIIPKYADEDYKSETVCYKKGDLLGSWVLMKKGFTPKMKFRVESGYCDSSWCKPVSDEVLSEITKYFEEHPEEYEQFQNTQFDAKPAVSTTWINLTTQQVPIFEQAMKELPELFTYQGAMEVFEKNGLAECFSRPPGNYTFVCEHTLWELDEHFDALYKNPKVMHG